MPLTQAGAGAGAGAGAATGPLAGLRVIEFLGIGPGPHCAMLLADLGAEVIRIARPGGNGWANAIMDRGRAARVVDIRSAEGRDWCRDLARHADVVIEGFRPGVMERLGLGPDALIGLNPRLVYGRITGWGQDGPLADRAGHDLDYLALSGVLAAMGRPGEPTPVPLNLIGDFGGGSMLLAFGIVAALVERQSSGKGQVVDAAIVDGVSSMMTMFTGLAEPSRWLSREQNVLAGSAPFYRTYLCRDGREIAVAPLEAQFFAVLMRQLGLEEWIPAQHDRARWGELTGRLAALFATRDMADWVAEFAQTDACVAPVLTIQEAEQHPHHLARGTFVAVGGRVQPAPAPRFSRTPGAIQPSRDAEGLAARWRASEAGSRR